MRFDRRAALGASLFAASVLSCVKTTMAATDLDTVSILRIGSPASTAKAISNVFLSPSSPASKSLYRELSPLLLKAPSELDGIALAALPWFQSEAELTSIAGLVSSDPAGFSANFSRLLLSNENIPAAAAVISDHFWMDELRTIRAVADSVWQKPQNAPTVPPVVIAGVPYWGISSLSAFRQVIALQMGGM